MTQIFRSTVTTALRSCLIQCVNILIYTARNLARKCFCSSLLVYYLLTLSLCIIVDISFDIIVEYVIYIYILSCMVNNIEKVLDTM